MQVRRVLLAAGSLSLLLLGGKLALDCRRHIQSKPQLTTLPATPELENQNLIHSAKFSKPIPPIPAEKVKRASEALNALTELSRAPFQETPASQEAKSPLEEKFEELKDDPAPAYDHKDIEIRNDEICPEGKYSGRVMAYNGSNFLGYLEFNNCVGAEIYYPIIGNDGNTIGYSHLGYRGDWIPFVSRGGKGVEMTQLNSEDLNDIYRSSTGVFRDGKIDPDVPPIGRFNRKNNQFEDASGKVLGRLDESEIFVPVHLSPLCEGEKGPDSSISFIKFRTHEEWRAFMLEALKQFPKDMIGNEDGPFSLFHIEDELGLKDINDIVLGTYPLGDDQLGEGE